MKFAVYQDFLGYGDFSDIYLEESTSLSLRWEEGKIQSITNQDSNGVGLRFMQGEQTRFAQLDMPRPLLGDVSSATRQQLSQLKGRLSENFSELKVTPSMSTIMSSHAVKKPLTDYSLREKIKLLEKGFHASPQHPEIKQVSMNYGEKTKRVGYLNSEGQSYYEKRTYLVFSITITAERNGDMQTAYESIGGLCGYEIFDGNRVERLAQIVGARARAKLDAPPAPVGEMPVVIASEAGGTLIHEAVGHSLEADAVLEGTSPSYVGKIGKSVANPKLSVYDNPTVSKARGTYFFDDEGIPSEATCLIDKGILKDYIFDRASAKKAGRASNGHGRRESYAHRPIPRMSNTYIAPGPDNPNEIITSLQNGLLVTRMGGGQVNTANGDFVFEVEEGFHVVNGKRTLVRGATLLGNGPYVLMSIDKVGSDHGWSIGTCGKEGQGVPVSDAIPTIHIPKLVVGGQS